MAAINLCNTGLTCTYGNAYRRVYTSKSHKSFSWRTGIFFVSGFLIYASYLNALGRRYFENRFLRLFLGLMFVTIGGATVVLIAHGWTDLFDNVKIYTICFFAQLTLGQAYNPGLFRDVGVGVVNGSLWTLTTEILFYLSVPVIVWLERRFRFTVIAFFVLSFTIYAIGPFSLSRSIEAKLFTTLLH